MSTRGQHPARPRPPLTKRLRPGHWVALDVAAAAFLVFVLTLAIRRPTASGISPPALAFSGGAGPPVAFTLAVIMCAPMALRRRNPMLAFGVAAAAATLVTLLFTTVNGPYLYLPAGYVLYLVAAVSRRRLALAALGVLVILIVIAGLRGYSISRSPGLIVPPVLLVSIFWTFGYAAGQRRAYAEHLRDRAASSAVTEERLRIARELHDVVAHSMTVIAVQAGYGQHVIDAQPAKAGEALGAIAATSRDALADMRRMLGVLRQPGAEPFSQIDKSPGSNGTGLAALGAGAGTMGSGGAGLAGRGAGAGTVAGSGTGPAARGTAEPAPLAPAPGLADLDRLVARIGQAGVQVELRVRGKRPELPPGIDLSAFRIVQEALTNVVKHADTPRCRVTVIYQPDELSVEVVDDGRGCGVPAVAGGPGGGAAVGDPGGGHGLIGMRERVSLYGGELSAAPLPERGFRVAARLPLGQGAA